MLRFQQPLARFIGCEGPGRDGWQGKCLTRIDGRDVWNIDALLHRRVRLVLELISDGLEFCSHVRVFLFYPGRGVDLPYNSVHRVVDVFRQV
jgi:hypothetical protein